MDGSSFKEISGKNNVVSSDQSNHLTENKSDVVELFPEDNNQLVTDIPVTLRNEKLKLNDRIQYKIPKTVQWITTKILCRASKATGRKRDWYKVENGQPIQECTQAKAAEFAKLTN